MRRRVWLIGVLALAGWAAWSLTTTAGEPAVPVVAPDAPAENGVGTIRTVDPAGAGTPASVAPGVAHRTAVEEVRGRGYGRLVAASGEPIANAGVQCWLGAGASASIETDASGGFELPVDALLAHVGAELRFRTRHGDAVLGGGMAVPACAPGDQVDFGDVVLAPLARLATGRVVDDRGDPVAGAHVQARSIEPVVVDAMPALRYSGEGDLAPVIVRLERDLAETERGLAQATLQLRVATGSRRRDPDALQTAYLRHAIAMRQAGDRFELVSSRVIAEAVSRASGEFELYGDARTDPFEVVASAPEHSDGKSPEVTTGQWIEVAVKRVASLAGGALLPPWMPAGSLQITLEQSGETRATARADGEPLAEFTFDDLDTGVYDAVFHIVGLPQEVRRITSIDVRPRGAGDPRLANVDLRDAIHRYEFRAVGVDRALDSPLLVEIVNGDGTTRFAGFPWREGRVELFSPEPELEVLLLCKGYRCDKVRVHPGVNDLLFARLHPVEVVLPGARAHCGSGRKVRVSMILTTDSGLPTGLSAIDHRTGEGQHFQRWHLGKSGGAWLGDSDFVQVPLVRNGPYQIMLRLHEEGVPGDASLDLGTYEVELDGVAPQRLVVPVDGERIAERISALQARRPG